MSLVSLLRRVLLGALASLVLLPEARAQTWETAGNQVGNKWVDLPYPVVFVANQGQADEPTETGPNFGLDVVDANNPAPQGVAGGLYVVMPGSSVNKLFPLAVHEAVAGLIDTPSGELFKGAVVEPNVSEDGRSVLFAYFHDAVFEPALGGFQSRNVSYKGSDLYRLDLGPLIDDPNTDPATLPIQRLTTKLYAGPPKNDVQQNVLEKLSDATRPVLAQQNQSLLYWGRVDMHPIELRTHDGLELVWATNRAFVGNSNDATVPANHQFGLYKAELLPDGSLGAPTPWLHFSTTSSLSPIPMREGLAFSYQSSTDYSLRWDIQALDSEGRWSPLGGYGHGAQLYHLGSLVVEDLPGGGSTDWLLAVEYYNLNNGGFGALRAIPLATAGVNEFVPSEGLLLPRQLGEVDLTPDVTPRDNPSAQRTFQGQDVYFGKFSSPRAGRKGGEYLAAWTPTSANRAKADADGRKCQWESEIVYRPSLGVFDPYDNINIPLDFGMRRLIRDGSKAYDLLWPTPMLSWFERTGDAQMAVSAAPVEAAGTGITAGEPFAEVGTSALWNTDIRPYDCYMQERDMPYSPNTLTTRDHEFMSRSHEGLRFMFDPADPCGYLTPGHVLGIRVNQTSHRTHPASLAQDGYETEGTPGRRETARTLGVYSVLHENLVDESFKARVPAEVPFEFHLLDRKYGMKLADVRSWHSLKPRESRTDCGGCHQHEQGLGLPFAGTEAEGRPALDLTQVTPWVDYDAGCRPVLRTDPSPARPIPEWTQDVWPGFQEHCGACHDANVSTNSDALLALDYFDEEDAYDKLKARNYATSLAGALGSPAFWAAYGERTDGRDNDAPSYQPDYLSGVWGFRFSRVHATHAGLCQTRGQQLAAPRELGDTTASSSQLERARWVRTLGAWIDHHLPRDTGLPSPGTGFDRFPPTVDLVLRPDGKLAVGFWDDSGQAAVELLVDGASEMLEPLAANGLHVLDLPAGVTAEDEVRVVATDPTGNRQFKAKTYGRLSTEQRRAEHVRAGAPARR